MRDSTALLLLNQQLYKETQEAIQRLPTKSYILDVIIANEEKLCMFGEKSRFRCLTVSGTS